MTEQLVVRALPSDFAAAVIVCALALVALARSEVGPRPLPPPVRSARPAPTPHAVQQILQHAPLDLNQATVGDLVLLPGIGPKLAERIVVERTRRGRFGSLGELRSVKGVGPVIWARIEPLLTVAPSTLTDRAPTTR